MPSFSITLRTSTNGAEVSREVGRMDGRLTGAMRRATVNATWILRLGVEDFFFEKAGGKYWDIYAPVSATARGAVGRISTPPNKERSYGPKEKRWMWWIDEETGEDVFAKWVNHPGSNAPDWPLELEARRWSDVLEHEYVEEVGRAIETSGFASAFPIGAL